MSEIFQYDWKGGLYRKWHTWWEKFDAIYCLCKSHRLLWLAKRNWLVQGNHVSEKLDSIVTPRGMKTYSEIKVNCEIYSTNLIQNAGNFKSGFVIVPRSSNNSNQNNSRRFISWRFTNHEPCAICFKNMNTKSFIAYKVNIIAKAPLRYSYCSFTRANRAKLIHNSHQSSYAAQWAEKSERWLEYFRS